MRLIDYIHQGGVIMYVLVAINIIGFSLLLWKFFSIYEAKKNFLDTAQNIKASFGASNAEISLVKDEVQMTVHKMESGLNTIKIIAGIAPLLGLLGTVLGILSAFKVIAQSGLSDPSLFAGGIAMALVTTVGGLIVAIPHYVGYNYISGALDDFEIRLEKYLLKDLFSNKSGE